ncbi:MAG: hypothetical protein WCT31_01150 [Candidatus Micrarchaeia archaeon]
MYAEKMNEMFAGKKYQELEEFCKRELSLYPKDIDLLFFYSSALEAQGKYSLAKKSFIKLFNITKDRIFQVCESIAEFAEGDRAQGEKTLNEITDKEENLDKLFKVFEVAIKNDEGNIGLRILQKCFMLNRKKTIEFLQELFEKSHERKPERALIMVNTINLLKSLPDA